VNKSWANQLTRLVLSVFPGSQRLCTLRCGGWEDSGFELMLFFSFLPNNHIFILPPWFCDISLVSKVCGFFSFSFSLIFAFHLYHCSNHCSCSPGFYGPRITKLGLIILGSYFLLLHLFKLVFCTVLVLNQISL
jgi:hypothetical protein